MHTLFYSFISGKCYQDTTRYSLCCSFVPVWNHETHKRLSVPIIKEPGWWADSSSMSLCWHVLKVNSMALSRCCWEVSMPHTQAIRNTGSPFLPIGYPESGGPGSQERKGWGRKSQCMLRKLLRCLTGWLHCLSGTPSTLKSVYSLRSARPSPSCETNCTFSFINFFLSGVFTLDSWGNVTMHSPLFNRQTLGN